MKKILLFLCAIFFTIVAYATGIGANDTTANCDNNTLGQTSGTANVEVDWQPNTIDIRWYSDDTRLSVQSSAKSCVYDDDLYLPAQPTKTGYTFKGWEVKYAIPAEYTELEYLESTGTQYIDTGVLINTKTSKYETKINLSSVQSTQAVFGTRGVPNEPSGQSANIFIYLGGFRMDWTYGTMSDSIPASINTDYTISVTRGRFVINGVETTFTDTLSKDISYPFYIATLNNAGGPYWAGLEGKTYYGKLYNNGTLVRNFIPAKRNSDNVVGMYDTVTGTFFTNAGSGSFVAGPVVQ